MATYQLGTYLENFLESVGGLPQDLRRNFTLMADLDTRCQELTEKIQRQQSPQFFSLLLSICSSLNLLDAVLLKISLQGAYLRAVRNSQRDPTKKEPPESSLEEIRSSYKTCLEYSDEKIALAVQTYRMIDKYIQRLDGDLKKFESELTESQQAQLKANMEANEHFAALEETKKNRKRKLSGSFEGFGEDLRAEKKGKLVGRQPSVKGREILKPAPVDLDMPVDPNEPVYCFCKRVMTNFAISSAHSS